MLHHVSANRPLHLPSLYWGFQEPLKSSRLNFMLSELKDPCSRHAHKSPRFPKWCDQLGEHSHLFLLLVDCSLSYLMSWLGSHLDFPPLLGARYSFLPFLPPSQKTLASLHSYWWTPGRDLKSSSEPDFKADLKLEYGTLSHSVAKLKCPRVPAAFHIVLIYSAPYSFRNQILLEG